MTDPMALTLRRCRKVPLQKLKAALASNKTDEGSTGEEVPVGGPAQARGLPATPPGFGVDGAGELLGDAGMMDDMIRCYFQPNE